MSHPKCFDSDYIDFLIASPKTASCCEAARSQPPSPAHPAHDAYTRLLHRTVPDPDVLYMEAEPLVNKSDGVLVLDDSTLDKFYAEKIEPVHRHWSGKHKAVVWGINLISLVWADGDRIMPLDYRIYDKPNDAWTKNDHFRDMVKMAKQRGFHPHAVLFDSWYSGLENLKLIRDCGWIFLTQLKVNRKVDLDRQGYRAVAQTSLAPRGRSSIWKGSVRSRCSRSSPETGTLNLGRPTTWRWTSWGDWCWPSVAGRSRSIIVP